MSECDISCKVLTPTLLHGSDDKTIELKTNFFHESIKFWWRAITGIDNKYEMQNKEISLFGNEEENLESPLKLRIGYMRFNKEKYHPTSNSGKVIKNHTKEVLMPGSKYSLYLYTRNSINIYKDIAVLSTILGGLGNDDNKGYGVSVIENIDYRKYNVKNLEKEILRLLNRVCGEECFVIYEDKTKYIIERKRGLNIDYTAIEKIEIGKQNIKSDKIINKFEKYINTIYDEKNDGNNDIKEKREVLNSLYISTYECDKNTYPIVTTFKPTLPKGMNLSRVKLEEYQDEIKKVLL